jgi:hypothetical protein
LVLLADRHESLAAQNAWGVVTWALLIALLVREIPLVRVQVAVVVAFASVVEYTFSAGLHVYVYRLDNVPAFVPPGHGLVYLGALALARSPLFQRHGRAVLTAVLLVGGAYALWGLSTFAPRPDVLGAFWFACLLGFVLWGRSPLLYAGAFLVVTYLELLGTHFAIWTWSAHDPTGLVSIGNPPSGAAGGYGWFDLAAVLAAPLLLRGWRQLRSWSWSSTTAWSRPLVDTALPLSIAGVPSIPVISPPASVTTGTSAAMSHMDSCGSTAMSTAPSATSRWDQKSP